MYETFKRTPSVRNGDEEEETFLPTRYGIA